MLESRVSTEQRRNDLQCGQFLAVPVLALVSAMPRAQASTLLVGPEIRFEHVTVSRRLPQCLLLSLMSGAGAKAARRCRDRPLMRMPSAVSWIGASLCGTSHRCLPGRFHARGAPCPARASFGTMWGLCDCDGPQAHAVEHLGASPRVVSGLRLQWAPYCETIGPVEPQLSGSHSRPCVTAQSVTQWAW